MRVPELIKGQLYWAMEGGDPVPLHGVHELTTENYTRFTMKVGEAWVAYAQVIELARSCAAWVVKNHPRWAHFVLYSKKARTRKKYRNRITREFLEEVNHGKD